MHATVTTFNFWAGDVVRDTISGELYKCVKVNPKNVRCQSKDGRLWNIDMRRLTKANEAEAASFTEATLDALLEDAKYRAGTVCKFKVADKAGKKGLFVVIKDKGDGTVSLAYLGGNLQNRYWPTVATASLEQVEGVITVHNV